MFDAYISYAEEKGRAFNTLRTYRGQFSKYLQKFYGRYDMTTVTYEEHQNFLLYLKAQKVKPATRNRIRSLMSVIHSVAIRHRLFQGAFKTNPFECIEKALEPKEAIEYFGRLEMDTFLEKNRESHYYPLLLLLLKTGLRIGEALGIHGEQIDKTHGMLIVDRQFDDNQNKVVKRTKAKKSRVIYLIDEVLAALPNRLGSLFYKPDGSRVTSNYFRKFIMPQACKNAGVKEVNPHGLRHTFAANYLMDGGSLWDLSKILGHHSVEITERYYAHFSLEHIKSRMKPVERRLNLVEGKVA